ncbi:tripartite tricarboxylate transporter permease [Pinisolibacter aquiterrae]|uniref:tripartite tricarboxylate transporter permease n=1 Tax=Pinisolibacter aquiterrae TaxID=2815579 RepID=UPI001C3D86C9|nr:tripartite tricarboxylate transporter permease [Pinisolibacter aquiterrae]MBV5264599.1 tripartite tricarboxylate transporter permease [Pinisolibacter aquiterrae]MCC8233368.1 tripartite tricarboxylate transporter permease [Pinisolibacter aquiterrae]
MVIGSIFSQLADPYLWTVVVISAVYGLIVGAIPGLTALMATALLVPFIIFMPPLPAVASIITASAMAIFAGDIPGALLRMPGTPASAAYTDDAHGLTLKGKSAVALGAGLFSSVCGGLISAIILTSSAPWLARAALSFSSVEYFWLGVLGLSCATFVAGPSLLKGLASLLFGLFLATVGLDPVSGMPRFTFGSSDLMGGLGLIPILIGLFAVSELMRNANAPAAGEAANAATGSVIRSSAGLMWTHKIGILRGSLIGTLVGALPGAGSDIAAWISYATARKFSRVGRKTDEDGAVERIMSASAANNASLGGAYIPATVFGIPGDAITAIVISVMFIKGINPGPTLFLNRPEVIYGIFAIFFVANLLIIPLGIACIHSFRSIMRLPTTVISPVILLFCMLGAFSVENTLFAVGLVAVFGFVGWLMEANQIPLAPAILGLILGPLLEQTFMTTMLKSQGDLVTFFDRPIGGTIGVVTLAVWTITIGLKVFRPGDAIEIPAAEQGRAE